MEEILSAVCKMQDEALRDAEIKLFNLLDYRMSESARKELSGILTNVQQALSKTQKSFV